MKYALAALLAMLVIPAVAEARNKEADLHHDLRRLTQKLTALWHGLVGLSDRTATSPSKGPTRVTRATAAFAMSAN